MKLSKQNTTSNGLIGSFTDKTVSLQHQWPFPFSNGKKVITPKVEDKRKSLKKEYPEALF